jgi:hypothetical protein
MECTHRFSFYQPQGNHRATTGAENEAVPA